MPVWRTIDQVSGLHLASLPPVSPLLCNVINLPLTTSISCSARSSIIEFSAESLANHLQISKKVKGNRKGFYKFIGNKTKAMESMGSLLNEVRVLVTYDREKAKVPNAFFACLYQQDRSSGILGPRDQVERLEQGRYVLGRRGSGKGRLKQTGHT